MARKRGGLAGIWDRNKGVIKTLAPIALGAIPGIGVPLATAAGAAMGGLDREGKGGIGVDFGGALKGGATGYLGGQTGKALAGGVKGLLTAGGQSTGGAAGNAAGGSSAFDFGGTGIGFGTPTAPPSGVMNIGQSPVANLPGLTDASGNAIKQGGGKIAALLKGARDNKDLIAMAGKGLMSAMPDPANDAAMMNAETQRMLAEDQLNQSKLDRQREEERRKRIAELLMPYAQQNFPQYFGKMNG